MPRPRLLALLCTVTLLSAACGSDDPAGSNRTSTEMEMSDGDSDGDDMGHDTDHDMAGDESMDEGNGDDHDHAHGDEAVLTEWPAELDQPSVTLDARAEVGGVVELSIAITGFDIVSGDIADPAPNMGHVHVYVDGVDQGMFFDHDIRLTGVPAGEHQLMIELSAVDHSVFALDGTPMRFMATIDVPGEVEEADVTITVAIDESGGIDRLVEAEASIGDLVEITVTSQVDEELHVHAYDHVAELIAGQTAVLRFEAEIPGVFEIELEGSGLQVIELTVS